MNFPNDIINLEALMLALAQQPQDLPPPLQRSLQQLSLLHQPTAPEDLRNLIRQYEPLEKGYQAAIAQLDQDYVAQERSKSLIATFPNPTNLDQQFIQLILPAENWVTAVRRLTTTPQPTVAAEPTWMQRGNTIVIMISGGAFLGVLLAQLPGAILGAIAAGLFGFYTTRSKVA
jgi:hypothetical protein